MDTTDIYIALQQVRAVSWLDVRSDQRLTRRRCRRGSSWR